MSEVKLGQLIDETAQRDAIHIAIAPAVAEMKLYPSQPVRFALVNDGQKMTSAVDGHGIGIVDPFLQAPLMPGDRFWAVLYPGTITSLRHEWTHPKFIDALPAVEKFTDKAASEKWLTEFGNTYGHISFGAVVEAADDYLDNDERYIQEGSEALRGAMYEDHIRIEFWQHYEIVTGRKLTDEQKTGTVFCCSC
jgi:hypothetical protein